LHGFGTLAHIELAFDRPHVVWNIGAYSKCVFDKLLHGRSIGNGIEWDGYYE
jgi:hypothetical protein